MPPEPAPATAPPMAVLGLDHLCLRVEPYDEAAIRRHLSVHGVAVGESGSRHGAEGEGLPIYLQDPQGNTVELKGPPA